MMIMCACALIPLGLFITFMAGHMHGRRPGYIMGWADHRDGLENEYTGVASSHEQDDEER
jgi:hypothetical protein